MTMLLICLALGLPATGLLAAAAEAPPPTKTTTSPARPAAPTKPATKAKPVTVKPKAATPKAKPTGKTEAELGSIGTETSDQFYGRLNINQKYGPRNWWFRSGYGNTITRTYGKNGKVTETEIGAFNLDTAYRRNRGSNYVIFTAYANIKNRSPYTVTYGGKTGYQMITAGVGRKIAPGLESEVALADITRFENQLDHRLTPVYSLRLKTGLTEAMSLEADTHIVQPFSEGSLLDTRVNLTYQLTTAVGIRLTYLANNMLRPVASKSDWDKSVRVSLVFSRAN